MAFLSVEILRRSESRVLQIALKGLELLLVSAGIISTMLIVKGAVTTPYPCEIVFSGLVGFWNSMRCLLSSPLYICIIINSMVVLIALSSTFQCHQTDNHGDDFKVDVDDEHDVLIAETIVSRNETYSEDVAFKGSSDDDCTHSLPKEQNCIQNEALLSETNQLDDTMETTWKSITGGRKQRLERKQLKRSETLNAHVPLPPSTVQQEMLPSTPAWKELRKSETFNDTVSITRRGGLRRDPSVSLDEFNNQVEAFIKKFNDNMRLQRQESDQRFLDMMNRGL